MVNLGVLYANGSGVEKDILKARDLYIKADALGNETATKYLKMLDDMEREEAALDPNAIVCSFCGLPETETRNFSKTKCPCKSTWYCNTKCQKKHWKDHRNDCQRLISEIKRKKKMKKKEALSEQNDADTTRVKDEADKPVPKKEDLNDDDDGDGGKEKKSKTAPQKKEKMKTEEEEEGDECPICLEILPNDDTKFTRFSCCGNGIHNYCFKDMHSMKMAGTCPFCRASRPTSHEECVKQLRPWVKKKKAWAMTHMGQMYQNGKGVKQSYEMARMLYELAAHQGDVSAMANLGVMYEHGKGVEQSYKRALEYYEQAADLGFAEAQYNLGRMYATGEGVLKNETKAHALWTLAAAQGHDRAINMLPILEKNMTKS
jgi:TPR repeat protein